MITPLLLFVYLILATVVLVNLLIAQMSKTYEMIIDESRLIWQFDYVHSIVIEYKDNRDVLPAPLNIIDMLIIDPIKLLRYCCRGCGPARNQSTQGFRLAPNAATTTELLAAEQRAARHFVKHHEAEKLSSTEHRVEDVQRRLEQLETDQRNMLEQLTGRFDVMTKRMVGGGRPSRRRQSGRLGEARLHRRRRRDASPPPHPPPRPPPRPSW